MEDLEQYFTEFVEPTVNNFKKNPASLGHAFGACVVLFHSVDYLAYPKRSSSLR